jgi:NAD(P)-dependent dehydrogenase (short-subunit alcohol dehydrogenase family)
MMRGLKDKVAVVTGGLGDLGFPTAQRLVEEGCRVVILDSRPDDQKRANGISAAYFRADITKAEALTPVFDQIAKDLGPCAILINTAALFLFKGVEATLEDFQRICSVNIAGTSLVTRAAVEHMKRLKQGCVVNFSSISGFVAQTQFATYTATKFAIRGLTKAWAQDLACYGIRVNSLCPGSIYTSAFVERCRVLSKDVQVEDAKESNAIPLRRQGRPEEVASVAAFLASEESSYMTGADVLVDGGYTAV